MPPLERTAGQPEPIAAHCGLSYIAFNRDGDAGTAVAVEDALADIADGESQRVIDMLDKELPGPIKTKWSLAFRDYDDCVEYIRQSNSLKAPRGGRGPRPIRVGAAPDSKEFTAEAQALVRASMLSLDGLAAEPLPPPARGGGSLDLPLECNWLRAMVPRGPRAGS